MSATAYQALVGPGANFEGVDQGIDFTSSSPFAVRALGPGIVTRVVPSGSGWPGAGGPGTGGLITYRETGDPNTDPLAGRNIYAAENIVPSKGLAVGSPVTAGEVIAIDRGTYPGLEAGFADSGGYAYGSPTGGPQPMGNDFNTAVQALSAGAIPLPASPGPFGGPTFGPTGSSAASGGGLGALAGTPTPPATANTSSSSGGVVGSLKEAGIRVLEVLVGLALLYLAFRQLSTVFRI